MSLPGVPLAAGPAMDRRPIPSTGERIPVLGMGTWITFNVGPSTQLRQDRLRVLERFFELGGVMVDSSPMYGSSEDVIGYCMKQVGEPNQLFSATKVWTSGEARGIAQMETSEQLWGETQFDLMQIHNLLDWETHLDTLKTWKSIGRVRYIGITTSHGRRHEDMADIMASQPLDFAQFTYNLLDREAEDRLLPLAADRGIATIVNRPFRRGGLFDHVIGHDVPEWALEFGARTWSQFFLKFVLSHPAVTCAIPATSQVTHMDENMPSGGGILPDAKLRRRMIDHIESL